MWECTQHLIKRLEERGESAAADLLHKMGPRAEAARTLAYRLYTHCERTGNAEEARAYNELIGSWHAIVAASHDLGHKGEQHGLNF